MILFSHGLGGSRSGSNYLGVHWAARGYVVVFLQHPGSDEAVWKSEAPGSRMDAMRGAASAENFLLRVRDVSGILDQLAWWNNDESHPLGSRLDLRHVGMSGHSFGAVTTQAVSGQTFGPLGAKHTDVRIKAALSMSPSPPRVGSTQRAFGEVKIPWMLMTGTNDRAAIGDITPEQRLEVFPALPPGSKYELVLDSAEHSAFTERGLPGDGNARNPNHHRAILALSTAFWDATLKSDGEALAWLEAAGPGQILEPADRFHSK